MNLPDAQQRLWQIYREAERVRVRQDMLVPLREFIESLTSLPPEVWHPWARELARRIGRGADIPVRLPLFRLALFPALHAGLLAGEAEPARLLAVLGLCPECREALPEELRSKRGLYEEAVRRDPGDTYSKGMIRNMYRTRFEYALHELPDEVLYGTRAASIDQCAEMRAELDAYRRFVEGMPDSARDTELISQATVYIDAYRDYLTQRPTYASYAAYLEAHGIDVNYLPYP